MHTVSDQLSLFAEQTLPAVGVALSDNPLPSRSSGSPAGQAPPHEIPSLTADSPMAPEHSDLKWSRFVLEHGRFPKIEDTKKPWEYRGWLLYYRMLLEQHPDVGRRWGYWCQTMSAGHLLESPIPQIHFHDRAGSTPQRQIDRWIRLVDRHISGWASVEILLDWFVWGFGASKHPPRLSPALSEALYREVDIGPMLVKPYDHLGEWIAMQKGNWNPNAFYPTPHPIVELMVRMTLEGGEDKRSKTVVDPCVGSGRMLMHASNYSLRLSGVDIDPTMVKLTCVNGGLYVPWLLRPFPETFFQPAQGRGTFPA